MTLTEKDPKAVDGASWEEEKFSESEVTIGDDAAVEVTLTNTITENPVDDLSNNASGLPVTGGSGSALLIAGGVTVLLGGAALFLIARRRRTITE